MPLRPEQLWPEALCSRSVRPILVDGKSQERLDKISLILAQMFTWTQVEFRGQRSL